MKALTLRLTKSSLRYSVLAYFWGIEKGVIFFSRFGQYGRGVIWSKLVHCRVRVGAHPSTYETLSSRERYDALSFSSAQLIPYLYLSTGFRRSFKFFRRWKLSDFLLFWKYSFTSKLSWKEIRKQKQLNKIKNGAMTISRRPMARFQDLRTVTKLYLCN